MNLYFSVKFQQVRRLYTIVRMKMFFENGVTLTTMKTIFLPDYVDIRSDRNNSWHGVKCRSFFIYIHCSTQPSKDPQFYPNSLLVRTYHVQSRGATHSLNTIHIFPPAITIHSTKPNSKKQSATRTGPVRSTVLRKVYHRHDYNRIEVRKSTVPTAYGVRTFVPSAHTRTRQM